MALNAGSKLGSYEIISLLGKGGMGEVYRARDPKLKRDVAIKILPDEFSEQEEWINRFHREAEVLASLNHHNIASIYDLQQVGSTRFLILELVEGDTLADILKQRRALPLDEAVNIGRQICEALEAAHEKGILHRDLKPANVKVDPNGKVKVLDFGLAKTFATHHVQQGTSNSPTLGITATSAGVILGTASYMSPEQARGKNTDRRTDIWAFGCVLYEMLTGNQAFRGEDVTEILASVVKTDPDWATLHSNVPSNIRTLLMRCLQKDVTKRIRDAGDIAIELEHAASSPAAPMESAPATQATNRSLLIIFIGLLIGALVAGVAVWRVKPASSPLYVSRFAMNLPASERLSGLNLTSIAMSPDGKRIVFVGRSHSDQQLYLRDLDSWQAKAIPGTESAMSPFFSPDGQWIAFFTMDKLKKVPVNGGPAVVIAGVANSRGGSWGKDGNIVFSPTPNSGLSLVSNTGGAVRILTTPERHIEGSHRFPRYLPNGALLFTAGTGGSWDDARIEVLNVGTGETKLVLEGGSDAWYLPTGHLVYLRAGTLMAVRFNLQRLEVSGAPVPMVEGILTSTDNAGSAQIALSAAGSLVYVPGDGKALNRMLAWVDRKGIEQPIALPPHFYRAPRISPNGQRVVLDIDEGNNSDLWLFDVPRATLTRRTFDGVNAFAAWTPDGNRIAFQSSKDDKRGLELLTADGNDTGENLQATMNNPGGVSWAPDGDTFAFHEFDPGRGRDLWLGSLKEKKSKPFLQTAFSESDPSFSRDGRWIAYQSDESGRFEVYVRTYPGSGGKVLVSTDGGSQPVFSADGRELFYREGDKVLAVPITFSPTFQPGKPEVLFERPYLLAPFYPRSYDVSPDGRRFLMIKENEQVSVAIVLNVVVNWIDELNRKLP